MSLASPTEDSNYAGDIMNMTEVRDYLLRRVRTIFVIAAAVIIIAMAHVMLAVPQFSTAASMYLGDAQNTQTTAPENSSDLGFLSNFSSSDDIETQIELLTSKALVKQAILETGLNTQVVPSESYQMKFWRWKFFSHGSLRVYLPNASTLEALYASTPGDYVVELGPKGSYRLLTAGNWLHKSVFVLSGILGDPASGNGVQLLLRPRSAEFPDIPGKTYNLQIVDPGALADALIGGPLAVTSGGSVSQPSKIIFIKLRWQNPYQAGNFMNQLMQDFIATRLSWKTAAASSTASFISQQLAKVSASLADADRNLALYQAHTKIVNVPLNAAAAVNALSTYQSQRTSVVLQQEALQQLANELDQSTGSVDPYLASQTDDPVLANLTNDLSGAEVSLTDLLGRFTDSSRQVQNEREQIATLQSSIKIIVGNDLAAAAKHLTNLNAIIAGLQNQINAMPAESLKVISLQRSSDALGQLYVLLLEKEETVEVSKAATTTDTRIIAPADMPTSNSSPNASISISFALLAGLVLGVGVVLAKRTISGRYDSAEEVRNTVPLPIFGTISKSSVSYPIAASGAVNTQMSLSEDFRLLRSRIYRSLAPEKAAIVTVVAPADGPGTAVIAANLAKSLADNGKRVLLVDADLKEASLSESMNIARDPGLIDCLGTDKKIEFFSLPNEKFSILPAGNRSLDHDDIFNEQNLSRFFKNVKETFDFVILISPALPKSADGLTLGYVSDLILSVLNLSQTTRRSFLAHSDLIKSLERPHGIIISSLVRLDPPRSKSRLNKERTPERKTSVLAGKRLPVAPLKLH